MNVFLSGGTGLIGVPLAKRLLERGDSVTLLTRRPAIAKQLFGDSCKIIEGNPMHEGGWQDELSSCAAVINLVGESVFARRWNREFKDLLHNSRVGSTNNIVAALKRQPFVDGTTRVLVNASAIGFYGPQGDEEIDETHQAGSDFLANLCVDWESAALACQSSGIRVALVRTGIVLDRRGGPLAQMLPPFRFFVGGPVGSGSQWMSWIHIQDIVGIFVSALDNRQAQGPINGTSPQPVTNRDFAKALGRALHRPSFLPMPTTALRLMFGEVADVISTGQRVLPRTAQRLGYAFNFSGLDAALADLL
jgi:uncharacterized protein (TIGR01777 family)